MTATDGDRTGLSRPGTKARYLQDLLLAQWRRHVANDTLPTSGRFLFYELEQQGLVSKIPTGKRRAGQDLSDQLTRLREAGLIPWADIVDDTRHVAAWPCASTVRDYLRQAVEHARLDPWARATARPFLICEARTVGGVLERRLAPQYLVAVASTIGQCQGFLVTDVAPRLRDPRAAVLYLGDHDLAGNDIEANTRRVLEREVGRPLPWTRIAITGDQVETLRANGIAPIEKHDNRYTDKRPHLAYEAEALGQETIEALVRAHLDARLPEPLEAVLARQTRQRADVRRTLSRRRPKT